MSEFMDRARAEAEARWPLDVPLDKEIYTYPRRATREHRNAAFTSGARWAVYQEPTDSEVEAADKAFHEVIMSGEWVTQEQAIRAALLAAQKVRAGQ